MFLITFFLAEVRFRGVEEYCKDVVKDELVYDLEDNFENDIDDEFDHLII